MKKTFLIRCEYPDGDHIPTQEFVENIQEYFAANIMDGERGRLVVKPVYQPKEEGLYKTESRIPTISELFDFVSLVKRMREVQDEFTAFNGRIAYKMNSNVKIETEEYAEHSALMYQKITLESEVDEYLKKMGS